MSQRKYPAVFMRGGTSKGIMFHARDLPAARGEWDAIFLSAMGSPDPSGRQLDGMGGGISSLSKVCVIAPSQRGDADVDYTFAQVQVKEARVDYGANCGNMSSAVGPFCSWARLACAPSSCPWAAERADSACCTSSAVGPRFICATVALAAS